MKTEILLLQLVCAQILKPDNVNQITREEIRAKDCSPSTYKGK